MPGKMTERRNGEVVRDVNTVVTETGSVYVVVPVPSNVGPTQPLPMYGSDQQPPVLDSNAPTPRLANGKPDLTGSWTRRQQVLHLALRQPPVRTDPARRL